MTLARPLQLALWLALTVCMPAAMAATSKAEAQAQADAAMSHDGLQKIKLKDVDLAYVRPGVSLAGYSKVKLDAVEVAFNKDWDPKRTGSRLKLTSEQREAIRSGVARLVQDEFVKALQAKDGYPVVADAGADVLRVKVDIINLYVNAPDTMEAGISRSFAVSAGEMTMVAQLFDSETGAVLARLVDRREGRNTSGVMTMTDRMQNTIQAEQIAAAWARVLRNALDRAHAIGKK
jgi:hypothetical protein